ncbi:MAG: hypothetical protein KDD73_07265 [Anaerolineales bacterium]|nr:hypothetical protein [Anaerolineales bacterium]MCB9127045.1 hypothetical protein [Ardenticatenales bacterium]MCB9172431.1 hypothetical protein [Ardenticatenales bacterium]
MLEDKELETLIGYILLADDSTRCAFLSDPQAVAEKLGMTLSDQAADHIATTVTLRKLNEMAKTVADWQPHQSATNWESPPASY